MRATSSRRRRGSANRSSGAGACRASLRGIGVIGPGLGAGDPMPLTTPMRFRLGLAGRVAVRTEWRRSASDADSDGFGPLGAPFGQRMPPPGCCAPRPASSDSWCPRRRWVRRAAIRPRLSGSGICLSASTRPSGSADSARVSVTTSPVGGIASFASATASPGVGGAVAPVRCRPALQSPGPAQSVLRPSSPPPSGVPAGNARARMASRRRGSPARTAALTHAAASTDFQRETVCGPNLAALSRVSGDTVPPRCARSPSSAKGRAR